MEMKCNLRVPVIKKGGAIAVYFNTSFCVKILSNRR